jgi:hypothetical protein
MNTIVHQTLSRKRTDHFLGSFEIVPCQDYQRGRPYQQTRLVACAQLRSDDKFCDRLKSYRNWNGHWYNERHVEEWVARTPAWLFPNQAVHVLASQNYAHLGEKIDLLLLDDRNQFHVVEVKAERVASNRGVTPDEIEGQMSRYVEFLRLQLPPFPVSLANYYDQFSAQFFGSSRSLVTDLQDIFGHSPRPVADSSVVLWRTFLTEGYDESAVDFFVNSHLNGRGPIRLIYYQFNPCLTTKRHCIEFWEVHMPSQVRE